MTGNPSGFLTTHQSLQGYATEQWVEGKGYLTSVDVPEIANWNESTTVVNNNSAIWNNTTNVVNNNSAQWGASNPQIPVTGINGIKISESGDKVVFEVSGDYADKDWVTAQGYLTAHQSLEDYQTTAGMTAYLTTADSANFLTAVPTGTMNESAFSYDENNKISGYNGSAFAGGSNTSGNYIPYTGIESSLSAFTTNSGLRIQRTAIGGGLNSNYINDNTMQIRHIDGPSDIIGAVLSNSQLKFETTNDNAYVDIEKIHKWDSASDYIQNNSATISEVNTSYRTNSGTFLTAHQDLSNYQTIAGMTAYANSADVTGTAQYGLTTVGWSEITGGGGGGVSGTNVIFKPSYEGSPNGVFYSATISGDVIVTTGYYDNNGAEILMSDSYSLSSIGVNLGNKLDKNKIEDSNTITIIDDHAEVTNKAYRQTGFSDISAYYVDVRLDGLHVYFLSNNASLYSAIVTVETTASGESIPDGWSLVSYENNSATFTRYYPLNKDSDTFDLEGYHGWGDFTNAEASATVYSALEIAPIAFKDDIAGITYTTGSI
jgi:hypothetical protein